MKKHTCKKTGPCTHGECATCMWSLTATKVPDQPRRERPLRPEDIVPAWLATSEDYWAGRVL